MKKMAFVTMTIILILAVSVCSAAHDIGVYHEGLFYFLPEFALAANYTAEEWASSEENRALLDLTLAMDYAASHEDEPDFSTNLDQLAFVGRDGNLLTLTICSADMKDILLIFFQVDEGYAWSAVVHGRSATPREQIETSNIKRNPDGHFVVDNNILKDLSETFLKTIGE